MKTHIKNGIVYDPKNGVKGEKKDIFIEDGKIVEETKPEKIIEASHKVVMPGGIDIHGHVATYGLNLARFMLGFPTVNEIGYAYARMGYTHVNEPLMTINTAAYVHHELSSIPFVDTSGFLTLNLNDVDKEIRRNEKEEVKKIMSLLLELTKSIGIKIYDASVKYEKTGFFYRGINTKKCLGFLKEIGKANSKIGTDDDGGGFPKIHLRTHPELLDEDVNVLSSFHLSHLFSGINNEERYEVAKELLRRGGFADIGIFCPLYTINDINMRISYDFPPEKDKSFISVDIGLRKPLIFSRCENEKIGSEEMHNSMNFALEALDFLSNNSSCFSFSTDSSKGCFFTSYPQIFSMLLSSSNRKEKIGLKEELPDVEYSLYDLAKITRSNPAKVLQLENKGHLGIGADADIAIYDIGEDTDRRELEKKLSNCEHLLKDGEMVIYKWERKKEDVDVGKRTLYCKPKEEMLHEERERLLRRILGKRSFRMEHLMVDVSFLC